jgi:hypothetical protein
MLRPAHQREQRHDLRGMARGAAHRADAALQRRDAFLQHGDGGVGQARIDEADLLQVEQRRGMVGVAEHIGGGLVDRRLARAGGRVGPGACVDLERVEAVVRCTQNSLVMRISGYTAAPLAAANGRLADRNRPAGQGLAVAKAPRGA